MSDAASFSEIDEQYVELLPERTVMSLVGMSDGSTGGNGDGGTGGGSGTGRFRGTGPVGRRLDPAGPPVAEHPRGGRLPLLVRQLARHDRAPPRRLRNRLAVRVSTGRRLQRGHAGHRRVPHDSACPVHQRYDRRRSCLHGGGDGTRIGPAAPGPRRSADHADGQVDVKHPAPGEAVGKIAAQRRADDGGEAEHRTGETLPLAALGRRKDIADDGEGVGHRRAAADALKRAEENWLRHIARQPAQRRGARGLLRHRRLLARSRRLGAWRRRLSAPVDDLIAAVFIRAPITESAGIGPAATVNPLTIKVMHEKKSILRGASSLRWMLAWMIGFGN